MSLCVLRAVGKQSKAPPILQPCALAVNKDIKSVSMQGMLCVEGPLVEDSQGCKSGFRGIRWCLTLIGGCYLVGSTKQGWGCAVQELGGAEMLAIVPQTLQVGS